MGWKLAGYTRRVGILLVVGLLVPGGILILLLLLLAGAFPSSITTKVSVHLPRLRKRRRDRRASEASSQDSSGRIG